MTARYTDARNDSIQHVALPKGMRGQEFLLREALLDKPAGTHHLSPANCQLVTLSP